MAVRDQLLAKDLVSTSFLFYGKIEAHHAISSHDYSFGHRRASLLLSQSCKHRSGHIHALHEVFGAAFRPRDTRLARGQRYPYR